MNGRFVLVASSIAALAACGSSGTTTDAGAPRDGTDVFGCAGSAACTGTMVCCAMPGASTTFGCSDSASCQSADQITCDGPAGCGGSTPVCCGVDVADGSGSYPDCGIAALGTSCVAASGCPTHFAASCTDTSKVVLCHVQADCTDSVNNKCCTFASGGASLTFCIDSTTAQLGGATCH